MEDENARFLVLKAGREFWLFPFLSSLWWLDSLHGKSQGKYRPSQALGALPGGEPIPYLTCPVSEFWPMLEEGAETLGWMKEQVAKSLCQESRTAWDMKPQTLAHSSLFPLNFMCRTYIKTY